VKKVLMVIVALAVCMIVFAQGQQSVSTPVASSSSGNSFTDSRDGKKYRTVKIGKLTWMAQNLNHETADSWCYNDDNSNCEKYGRLYNWNAAIKACPAGWRLPAREDWNELVQAAGGDVAGIRLKSKTGWDNNDDGSSGNGADDFGFSALPGGFRLYLFQRANFGNVGINAYWQSATENKDRAPWNRSMYSFIDSVAENISSKDAAFSVRCVQGGTK